MSQQAKVVGKTDAYEVVSQVCEKREREREREGERERERGREREREKEGETLCKMKVTSRPF